MPQRLRKRWREVRAREKETKHLTNDLLNESKQQSIYIHWEKFIPLKASHSLFILCGLFRCSVFNPELNKESKCCTDQIYSLAKRNPFGWTLRSFAMALISLSSNLALYPLSALSCLSVHFSHLSSPHGELQVALVAHFYVETLP